MLKLSGVFKLDASPESTTTSEFILRANSVDVTLVPNSECNYS